MGRIFINYRRQDSEGYVGRLYDRLIGQFDRGDIFMDIDSIRPGVGRGKQIFDRRQQAVFVLERHVAERLWDKRSQRRSVTGSGPAFPRQTFSAVFGNMGGGNAQLGSDEFAQVVNSLLNHPSTTARSCSESV